MADIGILTYHNNSNRGAILQAYCLWEALDDRFPDKSVEIIDYRTIAKEFDRLFSVSPRKLLRNVFDFSTCTEFYESEATLSSERIVTNDHKKAVEFVNSLDYDLVVVGSDVVWRRFEHSDRPFPNGYYLDPSVDAATASYAASANKTTLEFLGDDVDLYRELVADFDAISVRDHHSRDVLADLGITDVRLVPDPTFLVDIPRKSVWGRLEEAGVDPSRSQLCLHTWSDEPFDDVVETYRERGYQIVSPTTSSQADVSLFGELDPFEYYSMYEHFDMVITESFHSTIFSLLHETPFATVDVADSYSGITSKTESLLTQFDMLDRHVAAEGGSGGVIAEQIESMDDSIGGGNVTEKAESLRATGIEYIDELHELIHETNHRATV